MATPRRRFLIIGETGVGKTMTLNHLTDSTFPVSDSGTGVTFDFQIGYRGGTNEIVDTVGLSEATSGSIHPAVAFAKLIRYIQTHQGGFNGIFLVVGGPRVTQTWEQNYNFFMNMVSMPNIPCFLFINKQELELDYRTQYQRNKNIYAKFNFRHGFAGGWMTPEARDWTLDRFDECIAMSPEQAIPLYTRSTYWSYLKRVWRAFRNAGAVLFMREEYQELEDDTIEGILEQLGAPTNIARSFERETKKEGGATREDVILFEEQLKEDKEKKDKKEAVDKKAKEAAEKKAKEAAEKKEKRREKPRWWLRRHSRIDK